MMERFEELTKWILLIVVTCFLLFISDLGPVATPYTNF